MNTGRKEKMYKDWEENIANAYEDEIDDTCFSAFIDGAKWADENPKPGMVNKQEFIEKTISYFTPILKTYCSEGCVKELITGFVNSMEK